MKTNARLLITMGDVAGIGPEIIARGWPELVQVSQPIIVGDPIWLKKAMEIVDARAEICPIDQPEQAQPASDKIPVLVGSNVDLREVQRGQINPNAGQAAYDFLCRAIDWTLAGKADGVVTCPIQKEALHRAGVSHPGHTEILAERTKCRQFGMMLYARSPELPKGLGVVHVTLHCALREIFQQITTSAVEEKIRLLNQILTKILKRKPRIGVAGVNPHASDGGLFGFEEHRVIAPAIKSTQNEQIFVSGPWPGDTLFIRARAGEFDGIVAMYHDQGHIPMKMLGGWHAVNITVGLPIVRTSVAHGTAFDIAGKGLASPVSLVEACRVAALLGKHEG